MSISNTQEIIAELRAGHMVILVDEEDRENEGDLVLAADFVTPEAINFMVKYARGLVCLTLTEERCRLLGLNQMARDNKSQFSTAFTASIEAAEGVTTGISAGDRARTIQVAVAKTSSSDDIVQPGHIFPITAREGGVLVRAGHTEAGCDLAGMAGLEPADEVDRFRGGGFAHPSTLSPLCFAQITWIRTLSHVPRSARDVIRVSRVRALGVRTCRPIAPRESRRPRVHWWMISIAVWPRRTLGMARRPERSVAWAGDRKIFRFA